MRAHEPVNTSPPSQLVNVGGWVSSIQVYNNELYVLSRSTNKVYVYDLAGRLKRSWSHNGNSGYFNKLRVVNEKVVVPDGASQSLTVYTLQGQLMKQVKVPGMTRYWKALAVCGDDSVILSDRGANSVLRVNIDSGEVMWTSKHVNEPQGVVCYKDRYVLVTNLNAETKIWILDMETG
jgi:outer membrane protein assembly factor BamB